MDVAAKDVFSRIFRYRDPKTGLYEITDDYREAERIAGDNVDLVQVHFTDGFIDGITDAGYVSRNHGGEAHPTSRNARCDATRDEIDLFTADDIPEYCPCPCGSGKLFKNCHGVKHPDRPETGLGVAYRYLDSESGAYEMAGDETLAHLVAGDDFEMVWVWYQDGRIDHVATADEYQAELEVRIGERISAGVSQEKLNEFDLIDDRAEATRWLEENRPIYREIVRMTVREMERAIVL